MSTLKSVIILLCLLALTACSGGGPNFPAVLASATPPAPTLTALPPSATPIPLALSVNDQGLTAEEFNAELTRYQAAQTALGLTVSPEQARQAVADDLIAQFLLAQGAVEAGFSLDEPAMQQRIADLAARAGGDAPLAAWQQSHGYTPESFRASLARAAAGAWMRDRIMASLPSTSEQVHVRQILLYNEAKAKYYYDQLQAGVNFEELAALVDTKTRGDIGWFPRGYLTEKAVEEAAFSLEVGAYSAIIPSEVGFHILKVLERQPARPLAPDALLTLQNRALNEWLTTRRQQSSIVQAP